MTGLFLVPLVAAVAAYVVATAMGFGLAAAFGIYVLAGMGVLLILAVLRASCPERLTEILKDDQ